MSNWGDGRNLIAIFKDDNKRKVTRKTQKQTIFIGNGIVWLDRHSIGISKWRNEAILRRKARTAVKLDTRTQRKSGTWLWKR